MIKNLLASFWKDESGLGTIEIVVIIAVLVAVALIFRDGIFKFVESLMKAFFKTPEI